MEHRAFSWEPVEALQKMSMRIECLGSWGNKLLLGTGNGSLLIYDPSADAESQLVQHCLFKKPIVQVYCKENIGLMITLCDSMVNFHYLPDFTGSFTLKRAKGCHLFAVRDAGVRLSLAVAIKRRITIFEWDVHTNQFTFIGEVTNLSDVPRTMTWCKGNLFIGNKKQYDKFNQKEGSTEKVFNTGGNGNCIILSLPDSELLLSRDNVSIKIDSEGKPRWRNNLRWSDNPNSMAFSYPYVIAIASKYIEVRDITSHEFFQILSFSRQCKHICNMRKRAKKDSTIVYAATGDTVWRLSPIPFLSQVEEMVDRQQFEKAINFMDNIVTDVEPVEKRQKISQIRRVYALHLFNSSNFREAMQNFKQCRLPIKILLKLFPEVDNDREGEEKLQQESTKGGTDMHRYFGNREIGQIPLGKNKEAYTTLSEFLQVFRVDFDDKNIEPATKVLVDTTLVKLFLKLGDSMLTPFLKSENNCNIEECERLLQAKKKYYELVLLYKSRSKHSQALNLLSRLGQAESGSLTGPGETVEYLKTLGAKNMDLIKQYSIWVLLSTPDEGLKIFTNDEKYDELPRAVVYKHLKTYAKELCVPYVEWVIRKGETSEKFHNKYIKTLLKLISEAKQKLQGPGTGHREQKEKLKQLSGKLLVFLEASENYSPERMIVRFADDMLEERAILLSKLRNYEQALDIYVNGLKQLSKAEKICLNIYENDHSHEGKNVFLSLLKVLVSQQPSANAVVGDADTEEISENALKLLEKYHDKIDQSEALKLLPENISLKILYPYLRVIMQNNELVHRNNEVELNLLKSEEMQVKMKHISAVSKRVNIDETDTCSVCHKRILNSVFAYYPNGRIVHYHCAKGDK